MDLSEFPLSEFDDRRLRRGLEAGRGNSERKFEKYPPPSKEETTGIPAGKLDPLCSGWDGRIPLRPSPAPHRPAQRTAFKRKTLLHATFQTAP